MLRALVDYADREKLGDLDFETRPVDYELRIAADGSFIGLVPLGTDDGRAQVANLPLGPPSKNNPGFPNFVVDNAQYVLGTPKKGAKPGNAERCLETFRALVYLAADQSSDEGLRALASFLDRPLERARADAELSEREAARSTKKATGEKNVEARGDRVLLPALDSDGGRRLHERPAAMSWWKHRRDAERMTASEGPVGRCLVTGVLAPVARTHPALKGPPFRPTGSVLVSYEGTAFRSHGLEKGDNAPVSESAARKYTAALNALLERDPATKRRKSAIDLDAESVVVFWTREESEAPGFLLDVLAPPTTASDAADAVQAVWRGRAVRTFSSTPFYAVTLGVNSARVVVRDWFETTAERVHADICAWFDDLHIGHSDAEPVPLGRLLKALEAVPDARNDKRGLAPRAAAIVFRAAVLGAPLSRELLAAAIARMRVPPTERDKRDDALRLRASMIKAVPRRQRPNPVEVTVALDESNTERSYLLGRLFAALERQQLDAAGKGNEPGATIRDRYYGAASATPASVFGRLLALSMPHASKAQKDGRGIRAEKAKSEIMSRLPAAPLPRTLNLEEQGLFAIGYYHQRTAFFTKREEEPKGDAS